MAINQYNLKKWIRMMIKRSVDHIDQGVGRVFSLAEVKGYYNDLTRKVIIGGEDIRLPTLKTARGCTAFFPIQIFQYGLGAYDMYLLNSEETMRERFKICVDWAIHSQQGDGAWNCFFFDSPEAPYSSMAQGQGVSLLVRAYIEYKDRKYLDAAKKAVQFMLTPIEQGGTTQYDDNTVYLKEFTHKPVVLNGWIFSLFGLYDYLKVKKDSRIQDIFTRTIETLSDKLEAYDNEYWSKYDYEAMIASPFYHRLHISLLEAMYAITGKTVFRNYSNKWEGYSARFLNRTKAFAVKAIQKIREKEKIATRSTDLKVMQVLPEFDLAGAEIMAENLCVSLCQSSVAVCAVSLFSKHTAITERLMENHIPVFFMGKRQGLDLRILYRLYRLFKHERPDVIHTHRYVMPYVIPATMLARVPICVHTIHNVANKEVGKINRKFSRFFFRRSHVVPVAISPQVKQTVIDVYGISNNAVPIVMNGIDQKHIIPKTNYTIADDGVNLLHIGRFSAQKNHKGLIESFLIIFRYYPNVRLTLVGTGALVDSIKQKVQKLGLNNNVNFAGATPDVSAYLTNTDIFLLPSLWEGMPITLIEAMAAGIPIVATNVGGVPDMISNGKTGLLVNEDNEQIAQAVIKLINNEALRKSLGSAAKVAAKQFLAEEMAGQYLSIYKKSL